ncbi:hypothetical protein FRC14_003992 [Serendipita sp. 396]|nr:hypothetical protein FRC14_003992 [Serendipita sp. 396]
MSSYSKPEVEIPYTSINPVPLHPIKPPVSTTRSSNLPNLPAAAAHRQQQEAKKVIPGYTLSTHIFPAALPRTKCHTGPTPKFAFSDVHRKAKVFDTAAHLQSMREAANEVYDDDWPSEPLWIVANRFTAQRPLSPANNGRRNGITMTFMHANGFHKETWEESLKAFFSHSTLIGSIVDEIWLFDAANHGDSAILNEGKLGDIFNWKDNTRDFLQFLQYFLPELPGSELATHLEPLPEAIARKRVRDGFSNRQLVAVGHSLGGCCTCRAALYAPKLFSDIILVDPVIVPPYQREMFRQGALPLAATVGRRSEWPTREEALKSLLQSPFFRKWDSKVLDTYIDFAMTEDGAEVGIRLKTSGYQEAATFAEERLPAEVWELLPELDDEIEIRWVMSGKADDPEDDPPMADRLWRRQTTVWRRRTRNSNIKMKGSGHLIPQTVPDDLGKDFGEYLLKRYTGLSGFAARL